MSGLRPHSTEVFGFVVWLSASLCLVLYLLWAYLPPSALHALHVTYYPDRHWALAVPACLSLLPLWLCCAYVAYNLYRSTPLGEVGAVEDGWTRHEVAQQGGGRDVVGGGVLQPASVVPRYGIAGVVDMRVEVANAYMHRRRRQREAAAAVP